MNIDFFDTSFYDKESENYSGKRYLTIQDSYNKFFFQKRLSILIDNIEKYIKNNKELTIIEDGCADGFVIKSLIERFNNIFSKSIGIDISSGMVDKAKKIESNSKIDFFVKNDLSLDIKANVFLAIGFVSPSIFKDEFDFIKSHTKDDSLIIISLVSNNSLFAKFKFGNKEVHNDYWNFPRYKKFLEERFEILDSIPYGLFIPKLWAFPKMARILQPILEKTFSIFPSLFHEKLYFLKKRG